MSRATLRPNSIRHGGHPEYVGEIGIDGAMRDVAAWLDIKNYTITIEITGWRRIEVKPIAEPPKRPPSKRLRKAQSVDLGNYRGGDTYGNRKP